eukprot:GHVS01064203.1.p5 GENE.GHVS01064203.1~~GHVS01064203.1.p5  ORF type:complete len:110 (-),score=21.37 GHVS01064203.1:541-870(-)
MSTMQLRTQPKSQPGTGRTYVIKPTVTQQPSQGNHVQQQTMMLNEAKNMYAIFSTVHWQSMVGPPFRWKMIEALGKEITLLEQQQPQEEGGEAATEGEESEGEEAEGEL